MLTLERLQHIRLAHAPWGQRIMAHLVLSWDYRLPRRTEIVLEGVENIPRDGQVFLAMNHTDRYNYWPFQYQMFRQGLPFTATWVKGKYYERAWMGRFMDTMNNIPLPSRGYVLTTHFREATGRPPTEDEYRALRDRVDGDIPLGAPLPAGASEALRGYLGDDPTAPVLAIRALFDRMLEEVLRINREAFEVGLNVLVFPQGTRSKRLIPGRTGLIQMAQRLGRDIVPVGCNGSDRVYPGSSPFAKGGRIVYRIGERLALDGPALAPYRVTEPVLPSSDDAIARYGDRYQAATAVIMDRIEALLDEPYRFAPDGSGPAVRGVDRFVL